MREASFSIFAPVIRRARDSGLGGIDILVIDDEEDAREVLLDVLGFYGATVRAAASAEEGRGAILVGRPDVILCDICMPEESGIEFITSLKRLALHIPSIAVSANARQIDQERALKAGFDAFVRKPWDISEMTRVITGLVPGCWVREA